jgi:integrase
MTESNNKVEAQKAALTDAFGGEIDPLAEFSEGFKEKEIEPFLIFKNDILDSRSIGEATLQQYDILFRQWQAHMEKEGRHPTCPNENHVKAFIEHEMEEKDNTPKVVKEKIRKLNEVYEYWVSEPIFPHPQDYNPFNLAKTKSNFEGSGTKDPPNMSVDDLADVIEETTHLRSRAIILMQLKLGVRAGELGNIKLSEISLQNQVVQDHYPEMGTHPRLEDNPNAVYIPHDREGNKSKQSRILPLDDETRRALIRYLLIRPDNGEPWIFLSHTYGTKIGNQGILKEWKKAFHPEYAETERHRGIKSHYGRHFFTSFWSHGEEINRELIKYMRGDSTSDSRDAGPSDAIDTYIHTSYSHIEDPYRENIFKFGV